MTWLYRYEIKGIQAWILQNNKLRDLAGGSALIESLSGYAADCARGLKATVLQATSGAMTASFETKESMAAFAKFWPLQVALQAPGLQMVQAWVEGKDKLGDLFVRLGEKRNTPSVSDIVGSPWVARAGRSGLPAVPRPPDIRTASRTSTLDVGAVARERAYQAESRRRILGRWNVDDFEDLLDNWRPEGPVAVIHADGTGVGKRLVKIGGDSRRFQEFSSALKESTEAATLAAVQSLGEEIPIQCRLVVSAGDDLTCIVPARVARKFAATWLSEFSEQTHARSATLDGQLYAAAGIAIVHRNYPFAKAYDIAEALCRAAKQEVKDRSVNVLAFRRVTNSLVSAEATGEAGWKAALNRHTAAWVLQTDDEPLSELDKLVHAVKALPRGTLRTWLTYFQGGKETQAEQVWQRAREVAKDNQWSKLREALELVGANPDTALFLEHGKAAIPFNKGVSPITDALVLSHIEGGGER